MPIDAYDDDDAGADDDDDAGAGADVDVHASEDVFCVEVTSCLVNYAKNSTPDVHNSTRLRFPHLT